MASCPECKKYYPDKCPAHKHGYQATANPEPATVPPPTARRRAASSENLQPESDQYPKPASARKKPPRVAMSMGGWSLFHTLLGMLMCILGVLCICFAYFPGFFAFLFGSIPFFCLGKLFKCITEILKNQVEILNLLDQDK